MGSNVLVTCVWKSKILLLIIAFLELSTLHGSKVKCIFVTCNHVFLPLFYLFLMNSVIFFYCGIVLDFVFVLVFIVSAREYALWCPFLADQARIFFHRMMEKTLSMKEEMDWKVFISRQSRHFSFLYNLIKVVFLFCTLNWRVNNYASRQRKSINRRNENTIINI